MRGEGAHTRDSDLRDTPPRETLRTMGASGSDPRTGQDPTRQLGPQHVVWFCTILLLAFGVVMVYSTAAVVSMFQGSSGFSYFLDQVAVAVGGLILMIIVSRLDYRRWRACSHPPGPRADPGDCTGGRGSYAVVAYRVHGISAL